jgi:Flp pilus assembly protein TadG
MNLMNGKGQALVELALVIFLLLLLVMGIVEFGRAMYVKNTLTHAARAGARAAVVATGITDNSATPSSDCNYGANPTGNNRVYEAVCKSLYNITTSEKANITMTISITDLGAAGLNAGDMIKVSVTLNNYSWLVLPKMTNTGFFPTALTGETAMRYE